MVNIKELCNESGRFARRSELGHGFLRRARSACAAFGGAAFLAGTARAAFFAHGLAESHRHEDPCGKNAKNDQDQLWIHLSILQADWTTAGAAAFIAWLQKINCLQSRFDSPRKDHTNYGNDLLE